MAVPVLQILLDILVVHQEAVLGIAVKQLILYRLMFPELAATVIEVAITDKLILVAGVEEQAARVSTALELLFGLLMVAKVCLLQYLVQKDIMLVVEVVVATLQKKQEWAGMAAAAASEQQDFIHI